MRAVYYAESPRWHSRYYEFMRLGLDAHNIELDIRRTPSAKDLAGYDFAVLTGPNYWRNIENSGIPYLMINRMFFSGHPRDIDDRVALSWNGFNGRGTFCIDNVDRSRLERLNVDIAPVHCYDEGDTIILGQHNPGRCGKYVQMSEWINYVAATVAGPVRVRDWPGNHRPMADDVRNARCAVTLNSTAAVETLALGLPTVSMDEGSPVYAVTPHCINDLTVSSHRYKFFQYLANCQWHHTEISNGTFWNTLYPKRGPRLCDVEFE